jgi:predicted Zn-dependent peptidase
MLNSLSPNLAPSLDLMTVVVKDAAFRPDDIDRIKSQTLTSIAQQQKDPTRVANRLLPSVLYGANHPYGGPPGGDPAAIAKFSRADLLAFRDRWLRPDNAKIFIVSDRPLAEVQPLLEARFGHWTPPATAKGVKAFIAPPARLSSPKILLINRPGAPQSSIVGGQLFPVNPKGDIVALDTANDVLGGPSCRGSTWTSAKTGLVLRVGATSRSRACGALCRFGTGQADRTGDALAALSRYREVPDDQWRHPGGARPHGGE